MLQVPKFTKMAFLFFFWSQIECWQDLDGGLSYNWKQQDVWGLVADLFWPACQRFSVWPIYKNVHNVNKTFGKLTFDLFNNT
jgi:hypothetical protein